jgi:hypothetical protein
MEENQSSGASRQTDSHALGYCIGKVLCLQAEITYSEAQDCKKTLKGMEKAEPLNDPAFSFVVGLFF